jgi:4-hydroxy-tetrahydrodipicolinate synthase
VPNSDAAPPPVSAMCVTPFDDRERLDEDDLRRVLAFLAGAGVGVYLGSYGTGEGHLLRRDEIRRLYEIGVDEVGGRVPVYAAALGFQATDEVIELALEAAAIGVTAVQIHPPRPGPIAIRPTGAELDRYYSDVLGAVRTPVVLTNQVVMVGYTLPPELLAMLTSDHPQVVAVNTSDRDPDTLAVVLAAVGDRVPVYVGVIGQLVRALEAGARGTLCFEADLLPSLCLAVCDAFAAGDRDRLAESFALLLRLNEVLARYQNPRSVKAAMHHVGLVSTGALRRPYLELAADEQDAIATVVDDVVSASRALEDR